MSWLLFLDESGHDHRTMPYEVRGGVAIHASKLWPFVQQWQRLEESSFGATLAQFGSEIKGSRLLEKKRFRWAAQCSPMEDDERRAHCRRFLTKGLERQSPSRLEFSAYGQASLEMARGIVELLQQLNCVLFAAAIPRGVRPESGYCFDNYLRKDHVFLLERYFYFLEKEDEHGLLVVDESERNVDRRFVKQLQRYFAKTTVGRHRATRIVPVPFFVKSDMAEAIQAADLCIYAINWGFRLPERGMNAPSRTEIEDEFGRWLRKIQFRGEGCREGSHYETYGIVYVDDPFTGRP